MINIFHFLATETMLPIIFIIQIFTNTVDTQFPDSQNIERLEIRRTIHRLRMIDITIALQHMQHMLHP